MVWNIVSVDHSFKEGTFTATIENDSKVTFQVRENYNQHLYDNYVSSVWMTEIEVAATKKAQEMFGLQVEVVVNIEFNGKELIESINKIPEYQEVSDSLATKTTVAFIADFSEKELYNKCLEIVKWLVNKKYFATVDFSSTDYKFYISIPSTEIENVKIADDIKRYRLK